MAVSGHTDSHRFTVHPAREFDVAADKERRKARDSERMVVRRQKDLEDRGVSLRIPTGRDDPDAKPLMYLTGELLTNDEEIVGRALDELQLNCTDCDRIDEDTVRFHITDDPASVATRVRGHLRKTDVTGVSVGPHHVLALGPKPRIGPGSDPYHPEGPALVGPKLAAPGHAAVVDTGMWADLDPSVATVMTPFATDPVDMNPGDGTADYDGAAHGGFIADIITNVTGGSGGGATILAERAFDPERGVMTELSVVQAVERALANDAVRIVNLSLGTYEDTRLGGDVVLLRNRMGQWIKRRDVLFVCAAGNDERTDPWYPAGFAAERAFADQVVSVGALEARSDGPGVHSAAADFSNRGSWVTAWAPGVGVVGAYPDKLHFDYGEGPKDVTENGTTTWDGTSFAAPFVAGEVMRYASAHTGGNPVEAWNKMRGESPFVIFWPNWGSPPVG